MNRDLPILSFLFVALLLLLNFFAKGPPPPPPVLPRESTGIPSKPGSLTLLSFPPERVNRLILKTPEIDIVAAKNGGEWYLESPSRGAHLPPAPLLEFLRLLNRIHPTLPASEPFGVAPFQPLATLELLGPALNLRLSVGDPVGDRVEGLLGDQKLFFPRMIYHVLHQFPKGMWPRASLFPAPHSYSSGTLTLFYPQKWVGFFPATHPATHPVNGSWVLELRPSRFLDKKFFTDPHAGLAPPQAELTFRRGDGGMETLLLGHRTIDGDFFAAGPPPFPFLVSGEVLEPLLASVPAGIYPVPHLPSNTDSLFFLGTQAGVMAGEWDIDSPYYSALKEATLGHFFDQGHTSDLPQAGVVALVPPPRSAIPHPWFKPPPGMNWGSHFEGTVTLLNPAVSPLPTGTLALCRGFNPDLDGIHVPVGRLIGFMSRMTKIPDQGPLYFLAPFSREKWAISLREAGRKVVQGEPPAGTNGAINR